MGTEFCNRNRRWALSGSVFVSRRVDSPLGQSGQVLLLNLKVSESKLVHVLFDSLYATESASKLFIDCLG